MVSFYYLCVANKGTPPEMTKQGLLTGGEYFYRVDLGPAAAVFKNNKKLLQRRSGDCCCCVQKQKQNFYRDDLGTLRWRARRNFDEIKSTNAKAREKENLV